MSHIEFLRIVDTSGNDVVVPLRDIIRLFNDTLSVKHQSLTGNGIDIVHYRLSKSIGKYVYNSLGYPIPNNVIKASSADTVTI